MPVVDMETALKFIGRVKGVHGADSSEYQSFLDAMKDFKDERADLRETHRRVITLFREHPSLIEGYAVFASPADTINIPEDPQGNIVLTFPDGTMEIARDGNVVNETHTQGPKTQEGETELPELAEPEKRLLEKLRAQIGDSETQEDYEQLIASIEANLRISPDQRKALPDTRQGREFAEKLQGILGNNDELRKALSDVLR